MYTICFTNRNSDVTTLTRAERRSSSLNFSCELASRLNGLGRKSIAAVACLGLLAVIRVLRITGNEDHLHLRVDSLAHLRTMPGAQSIALALRRR